MKLPSGLVSQAQRILARVRVTIRLEVTDRHAGACAWCAAIGAVAASDAGRHADLALTVLALAAIAQPPSGWLRAGPLRREEEARRAGARSDAPVRYLS